MLSVRLPVNIKFGGGSQKLYVALAGVAQWIERQPVNQRVSGLIPR